MTFPVSLTPPIQVSTLQETEAALFYCGGRDGCVGVGRRRQKRIENRNNLDLSPNRSI